MRKILFVVFVLAAANIHGEVVYKVQNFVENPINHDLFGQFLEKPTGGETGIEAALSADRKELDPRLLKLLAEVSPPVMRFPGGSHVDHNDWTDMIDNAPGRENPARPVDTMKNGTIVTNRFGLHEYFALRDKLGSKTILVCNFFYALIKKQTFEEAAEHAAALVAYANLPLGTDSKYKKWADLRAKNGHPEPFKTDYIQIGNEWYVFAQGVLKTHPDISHKDLTKLYLDALHAYIKAIREVDKNIPIIIDGEMDCNFIGEEMKNNYLRYEVLSDPIVREQVRHTTLHCYAPNTINEITLDGEKINFLAMTREEVTRIFSAMPGHYTDEGICMAFGSRAHLSHELGYDIFSTEWNWNGWYKGAKGHKQLRPIVPGLGAAGFIHGLLRQGKQVSLATQSMMVGHGWSINTVRIDPAGIEAPYMRPQGMACVFYSKYCGDRRLAVELNGAEEKYAYPWQVPYHTHAGTVAYLDVVVTASEGKIFLHVINRDDTKARKVTFDLSKFDAPTAAIHHLYSEISPVVDASKEASTQITSKPISVSGSLFEVEVPAASASIFELAIAKVPEKL